MYSQVSSESASLDYFSSSLSLSVIFLLPYSEPGSMQRACLGCGEPSTSPRSLHGRIPLEKGQRPSELVKGLTMAGYVLGMGWKIKS